MTFDGGSMFQSAPPAAWERTFSPDSRGRVTFAVRSLLLRSPETLVLVDNGCGATLSDELAVAYGVDRSVNSLESSLAAAGVTPEEITHVLLTHLHFDHAGGSTVRRDGVIKLAFSGAEHLLQRAQLDAALDPRPDEAEAFIAGDVALLAASGLLRLLDGPGEILPGLEVGVAHGHTAGQQYLVIHDEKRPLLFPADVIPTAAHVRFPWFTAYDMDGRLAAREKWALLARAADENHLVIFDHEPRFTGCTVERDGRAFHPGRIFATV
jgi:glyoxylase-like metal-dependent hydrolase (beta-lactamase superfamily II)